ncbi:hypothetical protein ACFQ7J_06910 [Streptomyces sp. NPDC056501]|uniref:hypothetical protein n=1 Tax=Streptomyces sp. NPDC056501 TaxID=3345841 RepID=UPI0036C373CD
MDPTPAPTPTPTPTEPTAEPTPPLCPSLAVTSLGDPDTAIGAVMVESRGTVCFTVTVEQPGVHRILLDNSNALRATLTSAETTAGCEWVGYETWCELRAGTHTLQLSNSDWSPQQNRVSVVRVSAGPGCPAIPGTGYAAAPATGEGVGRLGVVCHSFTAAPGERITVDLRRSDTHSALNWITDDTGRRICTSRNTGDDDGCVLPEGSGGYRVLAIVDDTKDGSPSPYTLTVRRLSNPDGCVAAPVNAYGSAPTQAAPQTGCRIFTPSATSRYELRGVNESGWSHTVEVYAADGTSFCMQYEGEPCALTAGTPYTLVTDKAVRILDRASSEGCADGLQIGTAYQGAFGAAGEIDCANLPVPQGAHIAAATAEYGTSVSALDANGTTVCNDERLRDGYCTLGGTAPYRLVIADRYGETAAGQDYLIAVHRTDTPSACRTFPAGDFTANPTRISVKTGAGVFTDCLAIPANAHTTSELVQLQTVSGGAEAELTVFAANGQSACAVGGYSGDWNTCELKPGVAYTVLVQGSDVPAEFALTRRDVTATARGCVATPAKAVGGSSIAGVPSVPGAFACHQVTTAAPEDTLHLNVRDPQGGAEMVVAYGQTGDAACDYWSPGCAVTGSTRYQLLVQVPQGRAAAPTYRLDALRIGTATGPAPECVKVPNVSYGFGPLTATLSEQKTAICAVLPTASGDRFDLTFAPAGTFAQSPTPWLYDRSSLVDFCHGSYTGEGETYECALPGYSTKAAKPTTLVIGLPQRPAQASTAVRATFTCGQPVCGLDARTVGTVSPGTVGKGKIWLTLTGTALRDTDRIEVFGGSYRARSTTVSVAADRRSMTVSLDLTKAPLGPLRLSVFTHYGYEYPRSGITVVTALRNTAAPAVTGTAVVGGKVTAKTGSWSPTPTSYTYQWRADGVAIAGATASTYTLPSTLYGKKLTVSVAARKAGHPTVTATSGAQTVKGVAPKATKAPYTTGTVKVGRTLTLNRGTWTPAPTSYAYQWYANGRAISGATKAWFTLTKTQRGTKITVRVTAYRTGHLNGVAWTRATSAVVG